MCLFVYSPSFLPYLLSSFLILSSLLIYFLTRLLPDLSISSRIGPFHFPAGCRKRWPNLALVFWGVYFMLWYIDVTKWVSNVRPSICTYACPSILKRFFDFNEIWHVGRGRWVMHDGIQYDPIPDPRSRSPALQSWKFGHFQQLSPLPFTTGAGNWPLILKLGYNIWRILLEKNFTAYVARAPTESN